MAEKQKGDGIVRRCKGPFVTDVEAQKEVCRRKGWSKQDMDAVFGGWPEKGGKMVSPQAMLGLLMEAYSETGHEAILDRQRRIEKAMRVTCGYNVNEIIDKAPYDGALVEAKCPKCLNVFTFRKMPTG